jgi:hypothetical protein
MSHHLDEDVAQVLWNDHVAPLEPGAHFGGPHKIGDATRACAAQHQPLAVDSINLDAMLVGRPHCRPQCSRIGLQAIARPHADLDRTGNGG